MTDARHRGLWHRVGPVAALMLASIAGGCSSDPDESTKYSVDGQFTKAANDAAVFTTPFDATPDPDGKAIYIVALSPTKGAGVFKGSADGTAAVTELAVGDPFVAPFNVTTSTDGSTLFVSDPAADDEEGLARGQIFAVTAATGAVTPVSGTAGTQPRGLEVVSVTGGDVIIYAGTDPADGQPTLFKVAASGGTPAVIVKGAPITDPSGVAIAPNGDVYFADSVTGEDKTATVFKVPSGVNTPDGVVNEVLAGIGVGYPVGIALSMDGATLIVSGIDAEKQTDVVLRLDIASKEVTHITASIDSFNESAGLHRSKKSNTFAWADSKANGSGTVFTLK